MATKNLDVQYHQQDTDYYCGAACAQMVLAEIGAGLLDQDDLYNDNHSHSVAEPGWYTAPDGLQWTLINRKPASFTNTFALFALNTEDAISRKIVWTIFHYGVAPVAMVYGWAHWIVIRGYDISADPANSTDNGYSINSFDVNNPWPPTPTPGPPPAHSDGDICGSGGNRGVANEHIAYNTWQSDYMTGIPSGHWGGKFVAICDPLPPSERPGKSTRHQSPFDGKKIIEKKEIEKLALDGIKLYGLQKRKTWKNIIDSNSGGEPVLVQRLDRTDSYYYIVPFNTSENRSSALVSIDARFGDYKQSVLLPEPTDHLSGAYDRKKITKNILNNRFSSDDDKEGRFIVRPEAYCLYPTLVWKPCRESLSPFWPFHMYTIGSRHIYVRIDGTIFTQLHDDLRGI
ncbi:MAG: C39 family peptidase [Ferruginibacter sp.]